MSSLKNAPNLILPKVISDSTSAWHLFVIQHPDRDKLAIKLNESGIDTLIHYPLAPHLQKAYESESEPYQKQPIAEQLQSKLLSLPMGPTMTIKFAEFVCITIQQTLQKEFN
jgi:dTDP-4-amino-4,6-dideoxygalactose transaminase